ncbi:MAG: HAD family phosphatase [Clostridia bacterium]|nr:HAD family phosphatase [Clostridia bacterium]
MKIENFVFDMGNVITEFRPRDYVAPFAPDEKTRDALVATIFASREWQLLDRGEITYPEAVALWQSREAGLSREIRSVADNWYKYKTLIVPVNQLAMALKDRGYGIYLLSNASDKFPLYKSLIPALRVLDGWVLSYECHILKPDPAIFRLLFDRYALSPESCFYIDDMEANVEAGRAFGMEGIVFPTDGNYVRAVGGIIRAINGLGVNISIEELSSYHCERTLAL